MLSTSWFDIQLLLLLAAAVSTGISLAQGESSTNNDDNAEELVLSESLMRVTLLGIELSAISFDAKPKKSFKRMFGKKERKNIKVYTSSSSSSSSRASSTTTTTAEDEDGATTTGEGEEESEHDDDDEERALVVKQMGYCFAVFRGTTQNVQDWLDNFDPGYANICTNHRSRSDGRKKICCKSRRGFQRSYLTDFKDRMVRDIRACAANCTDPDDCVVLTGHSQGGALAAVASIELDDLNPRVVTFGQPPALDAENCPVIAAKRVYHFINTLAHPEYGILYDYVPFVPSRKADDIGHMIMLSDQDSTGVAYIGLNVSDHYPGLVEFGFLRQVHSLTRGYRAKLRKLAANYGGEEGGLAYPIRTDGYADGSYCTRNVECQSKSCKKNDNNAILGVATCAETQCETNDDCAATERCSAGACRPKSGSCHACEEDSDCASDFCSPGDNVCGGPDGLMDDGCWCNDTPCRSGRCEGIYPFRKCRAKLPKGSFCNEDSDCLSNDCWWFHCQ